MSILVEVGVSIIIGLLRGGRLERLGELGIRRFNLIWGVILLRVAAGMLDAVYGMAFAPVLQVAAYFLLLYLVYINLDRPGLGFFGLGSLLNLVVIAANGGKMPVSAEAMARAGVKDIPLGTHMYLDAGTRLPFLADVIPVSWHKPNPVVISVGDILITVGIFIFIQHVMLGGKGRRLVLR